MRSAVAILGVLLTLAVVVALCQAMLIPRSSTSRIAAAVNGVVAAVARAPLRLLRSYEAQDRWLSGAAPISVLLQLVAYVAILIATMGLVVFGTTSLSLNDAMYQSGATLTTLGIVEPVNESSAIATFVAAFLGLVIIAIFIGYLMAIYGAYVARESGMARAAILAGEPAWGPMFLRRGQVLGLAAAELPDARLWLDWFSTTRLNAEVNPILMEFRSPSARRHWVTTALAVLDAAALQASLSDDRPDPHAVQLLTEGAITLRALNGPAGEAGHNWDVERRILAAITEPRPSESADSTDCGVAAADFSAALDLLGRTRDDAASARAWQRFSAIRRVYFAPAAQLARRLHAVPAPWSGGRDPALPVQYPETPLTPKTPAP